MVIKYSVGDVVSANMPLVHVLNHDKKGTFCDYCLRASENLKKCGSCKHMHYCDKLCQKLDWKKHKWECDIYQKSYSEIHHNLDRFLLRINLFLMHNPDLRTKKEFLQYDQPRERSFEDLMTHREDIEKDATRINCFVILTKRYNRCNIGFDQESLFEQFCKICINSFSILDVNLNEIGSGLYIAESSLDHSCIPNAAPVFNGIDLEIRAIKNIDEDDRVTINYVDLKEDREKRQHQLKMQYYFECKCSRCTSDLEVDCARLRKLNENMDACIDQQSEWHKAYELCDQSIDLYNQVYGDHHPDLTVQLFRLTKLRLFLTRDLDNEALQLVAKTKSHIHVTHGPNHELYKMFIDAINQD